MTGGGSLAVDSSGKFCGLDCHRVHRDCLTQFLDQGHAAARNLLLTLRGIYRLAMEMASTPKTPRKFWEGSLPAMWRVIVAARGS
jgi:hypothetical protein